jgi:hypothetical protein
VSVDPIALLERELVSAARRRAAAGPVPAVLPWPRARRRRIRVGDALSAAAAAGAVIVALAALALLGGGGGGHPASIAAATPRDSLVATLAVLRRPQTAADRDPATLRQIARLDASSAAFRPDIAGIRLAGITPWGEKVVLVPFAVDRTSQLLVFVGGPLWGGAATSRIRAGGIMAMETLRQPAGTGVVLVVPDGVVRVSLAAGAQRLSSTGVRDNIAVLRAPAGAAAGLRAAARITWYGPGGVVVGAFR